MKTKLIHFFLLIALLFVAVACASPQEEIPIEPVVTELAPDPNRLPDGVHQSQCGDEYWFNQTSTPEFAGFEHKEILLSQNADSSTAHQTWLIEVESISINDRIIYFPELKVLQRIEVEGEQRLVQEFDPEKWINKAIDLSHETPSVTINLGLEWKYDARYGYGWYVLDNSVSCSIK